MLAHLPKVMSLCCLLLVFSCTKDHNSNSTRGTTVVLWKLNGVADGSQLKPSVASTATGNITGTFDAKTFVLSYRISWNGLIGGNATHIFLRNKYEPPTSDPIDEIPITGFTSATSGVISGAITLPASFGVELIRGLWYFDIHSVAFPNGEIRGAIQLTL